MLKTGTRTNTRTRTSTEVKTGVCRQISMWAPGFQEKMSDPDKTKRSSRAAGGGSFNQSFTLQELFRLLRLAASCCAALSGSRVQHTQEESVSHTSPQLPHNLHCWRLNPRLEIQQSWGLFLKFTNSTDLTRHLCEPPVLPLDVAKPSTRQPSRCCSYPEWPPGRLQEPLGQVVAADVSDEERRWRNRLQITADAHSSPGDAAAAFRTRFKNTLCC